MNIKTAILTILFFFLLPIPFLYGQTYLPEQTYEVVVTGRINIDLYSTVTLDPVTVEIYSPSTVTIRILSPSGTGIPGRTVVIVSPSLSITQPTTVTDSTGRTTGSVYSSLTGTYNVCAKDITYGYDIYIQNCKTLYVVPVAIPVIVSEPYYTKGTTNTLYWNNLGGGYQYDIEVSESPTFGTILSSSGWISNPSFEFTDLENEKMYFYRVKAKNPYGGVSAWSSSVFSVQDAESPVIETLTLGGVGDNDTVNWDPSYIVKMVFRVTDNLQLDTAIFLCVNSTGGTYECVDDYYMEGDNLIVDLELRDLERISNAYLREQYEFCVEAMDAAGNITRVCNIYLNVPKGEEEVIRPPVINQIAKTVDDISVTLDDTIGQLDPSDLETVTTTTSIVTATTAVAISIGSLWNLPYLFTQFIVNLLSWFGFRAGAKPLGYVYDAVTKEPIPQAIVRIMDENGKMVWSDVTDSKGYFSARLKEGKYKILVRAPDYTYPSNIVYGKEDYPLTHVYHGEVFELKDDSELNFAIPLDPKELSKARIWREQVWSRVKYIVNVLHVILFVVGLIFAIYLYSKNPYWLTMLVLVLYIPSFFFIVKNIFIRREKYGVVRDLDGNTIEGVVIGLRETEFDKVVAKRVTDMYGRYRMLMRPGRYILELLDTAFKVEDIEGDSEIEIEKDEEWVIKDITVSRIKKG